MNKFESKYYNTALLMNQALIELLNKKDYKFLTIKEICKKAGVNRSTFYLHYDNIDELLCETIENVNKKFLSYFTEGHIEITNKIKNNDTDKLILITPEYLLPYLNYIKENKVVYLVSAQHPVLMQSIKKYELLQENILYPIFSKFNIQERMKKYLSAYYIHGIYAIIEEWLKADCKDDTSLIIDAIISCVRPFEKEYQNQTKTKTNKKHDF